MDATKAQFRLYAVIRTADGRPKFDDIFNVPLEIWDSLADHEKREIETEILKRKQEGLKNGSYP